jgi:hypothetical protein
MSVYLSITIRRDGMEKNKVEASQMIIAPTIKKNKDWVAIRRLFIGRNWVVYM